MPKTTLEPERVRSAVAARLGEATDLRPLIEGGVSQAFEFLLNGAPHVVRVAPDSVGYDRERFVLERLVPPGIPVAPIVDSWRFDDEHALCVSRRIPGTTVDRCDDATARRIAPDVVGSHRALAAADVSGLSGFGSIEPAGRAAFGSWSEFLLSELVETPDLPPAPMASYDEVRLALARAGRSCPDIGRLVHGDFGGDNLLTDGGVVTGVLDWAQALIGDPMFDVAWSLFWGEWVAPMRVHGDALWQNRSDEPLADVRLRACLLHIGLGSTRYFLRENRPDTAQSMIERARLFSPPLP